MTLNEFISHQKHNSVDIIISQDCYGPVYTGNVGSYKHWIYKSKLDNVQIVNITFATYLGKDIMIINLDPDADLSFNNDVSMFGDDSVEVEDEQSDT